MPTAAERHQFAINAAKSPRWSNEEIFTLQRQYPQSGKIACAELLGRSVASVRYKAAELGLRRDTESVFFKRFQAQAAATKRGRKRPAQAEVMRKMHAAGKFKKTKEMREAMSFRVREWLKTHEHPRGARGMKHTEETKRRLSEASRRMFANMTQKQKQEIKLKIAKTREKNGTKPNPHGSWKAAWRVVGGRRVYFRSAWEANYARYLEWLKTIGNITEWEHEPETFWFDGVRRGCVSYLPDFRVTNPNGTIEYHEVKGWMDAASKTKIKRMAKYHPTVKLLVIDAKSYRKLASQISTTIAEWE